MSQREAIRASFYVCIGFIATLVTTYMWGWINKETFYNILIPFATMLISLITLLALTRQLREMQRDRQQNQLIAMQARTQIFLTRRLEFYSSLIGSIGNKDKYGDISNAMENNNSLSQYELYASEELRQELRKYFDMYHKKNLGSDIEERSQFNEHFNKWYSIALRDQVIFTQQLRDLVD